ncbi:MAG: hypothetical protein JSW31_18630 [Burkholderiales bacterium]|nr:MAG: hypothetical protein JSW31_18630 [Burkholderiales bacterium]
MNEASLYLASAVSAAWGLAHLFATRGVVKGFGALSDENRNILTMEWIVEGVALIALAAFVAAATAIAPGTDAAIAVYAVAIVTYVALAIVSFFTGFRVDFLPFRMCPFVLCASAALIAVGAFA